MAAAHGFQVFRLGFLARRNSYEMGVPAVPLGELYGDEAWQRVGGASIQPRSPVERIVIEDGAVQSRGRARRANCARITMSARCPLNACRQSLRSWIWICRASNTRPSPESILWFDRPVTDVPQATLLDRTIQWMFNKARRPRGATGGERVAQFGRHAARGRDRAGDPGAGGVLPGGARREAGEGARGQGSPGDVFGRARAWNPGGPRAGPTFGICSWPAIGPGRDGRRPWKARCAAGIWRPRRWRRRRESLSDFYCPISREIIAACGNWSFCLRCVCRSLARDDLTRLQIHVTNERGKPVDRASVIVKFVSGRSLKALGLKKARLSWELKSSQEGMAKIPAIPKGKILIQINAKNYQTFGDTFDIDEDERRGGYRPQGSAAPIFR